GVCPDLCLPDSALPRKPQSSNRAGARRSTKRPHPLHVAGLHGRRHQLHSDDGVLLVCLYDISRGLARKIGYSVRTLLATRIQSNYLASEATAGPGLDFLEPSAVERG